MFFTATHVVRVESYYTELVDELEYIYNNTPEIYKKYSLPGSPTRSELCPRGKYRRQTAKMPNSDTESSTIHQDQYFDISTKAENETAESSEKNSIEQTAIEQVSSRENSKDDLEKGSADVPSQQPAPPGLSPDDFPDGGLEAVSVF